MMPTGSDHRVLRFGVFEVDLDARELRKRGLLARLQDQPLQILCLLLSSPGQLITREELRSKLWSANTFVDFDRNLNKAINKLRLALGDSAERPIYIETVPRHGYRFIAACSSSPPTAAEEPAAPAASAVATATQRFRWRVPYVVAALAVAAIVGAAALYNRGLLANSLVQNPRRSVAVLGFENLSGRADDAWLSTALSDWLGTELSVGGQLRTISAESVARMKKEMPLPELDMLDRQALARIRQNLGTDLVVAGSFAALGTGPGAPIRLDLQLKDARNGDTLEAFAEIGSQTQLFDLVSRAGARLRGYLGVGDVSETELAALRQTLPANPLAARWYAEGQAKLRVFDDLAARDLLQRAVAAEPDSALTHSALAAAWYALGYDANARQEARDAFDRAAPLPRAQRLWIEARYRGYSRQWAAAVRIYRALFEFFPDNVDYGLGLAAMQIQAGQGRDALATVAELSQLPAPLSSDPRIYLTAASAAETQGDFKSDAAFAARAAVQSRAAGATLLLAQARMDQSWAWDNLAEPALASRAAAEAQRIYAQTGDRRGQAQADTLSAIAAQFQGDTHGAQILFQEALAIFTQIGNPYGVATEWNNIGSADRDLGKLELARRNLDRSRSIYEAIGHQDGVALTEANLGDVLLGLGLPREAQRMFAASLTLCRQLNDRSKAALDLAGLGRVAAARGETANAERQDRLAMAEFEAIGDRRGEARARLDLARLFFDQGKVRAAALAAGQAAEEFRRESFSLGQAQAQALLARTWMAQGNRAKSLQALAAARQAAARCQDQETEWLVALAHAHLEARDGANEDRARATQTLSQVREQAAVAGFRLYEMNARLAQDEVTLLAGRSAAARSRLQTLENEAARQGFLGIARRAALLLAKS